MAEDHFHNDDHHDDQEEFIEEQYERIGSTKPIFNNYIREYTMLKTEIRDLKDCQFKYLSFSITATALLLGLLKSLSNSPTSGIAYLFPLVILLPAWIIFFDKAASITRIVSYLRAVEEIMYGHKKPEHYYGWERSLDIYRKNKAIYLARVFPSSAEPVTYLGIVVKKFRNFIKFIGIIRKNKQYHYWDAVFTTFLIIPLICLTLSAMGILPNAYNQYVSGGMDNVTLIDTFFLAISMIAMLYVTYISTKKFYFITAGEGTYDVNDIVWNEIIFKP